jgi:hypothetical protein
MIRLGVE